MSGESVRSDTAINRIFKRLQIHLSERDFYHAHQLYRTLYYRYAAEKRYSELIDLLYEGTLTLLDNGQLTSGSDLASLFLETLKSANSQITPLYLDRIQQIYRRLKTENSELANRLDFVCQALQWSKQICPQYQRGHPNLNQKIAIVLWQEKCYDQARYHFLLSTDGEACATFLIEFHQTKGYPGEVDLFIAQAVLQFLCYQQKQTANATFFGYTTRHPQINHSSGPPFVFPMLNFLWLLLLCIDSAPTAGKSTESIARYSALVDKYQPSIQRDPCYLFYLDKIGQLFFGLPPPPKMGATGSAGFLGNLLRSFLNDDTIDPAQRQSHDISDVGLPFDDDIDFDGEEPSNSNGRTKMANGPFLRNQRIGQSVPFPNSLHEADLD